MSLINVDWDFQKLEELIEARGEDVVAETAVACTCRNGDQYASTIEQEGKPASQRSLSCPQCYGDGFIYRNARIARGLVTSVNPGRDRRLLEIGYAVPGDAVFSPSLRAGLITDFDKITFQFSEPLSEGQVIMRGAAHLEENATFVTDLDDNEDRLWYEAGGSIWCEDSDGVVYTENVDYKFVAKKLVWIGNKPRDGVLYTIKYLGYPEWICYATPMDRYDRNRNLGQRVLIRKKHVAFTTDSPLNIAAQRSEEASEFTTRTKI